MKFRQVKSTLLAVAVVGAAAVTVGGVALAAGANAANGQGEAGGEHGQR